MMAKNVVVTLVDDLDGLAAEETLTFAIRGIEYEIDLSSKNIAALEEALQPYVERARKIGGGAVRMRRSSPKDRDFDLPSLREWAAKTNVKIPARGRIPAQVVEAYRKAGGR